MWISRQLGRQVGSALRWIEAFGLAIALAFLPELARLRAGAVLEPHLGWIVVLVLAARDGSRGFFTGLVAAAGAVGIASVLAGTRLVTAWSHLDSGPDLIAFGACLTVSWIASWHLRRQANLSELLRARSEQAADAEATGETLRDVVETLRARVDRTSTSLSFIREVAMRLEGSDLVAAAEAAADLALARTGAYAATVHVGVGEFQRLLAVRDARGPKSLLSPLLPRRADLTVPIRNGHGPVGVIALWGIPPSGRDGTAHDLSVIASWCADAFAVDACAQDNSNGQDREAK